MCTLVDKFHFDFDLALASRHRQWDNTDKTVHVQDSREKLFAKDLDYKLFFLIIIGNK
jgi:hypothetical protein